MQPVPGGFLRSRSAVMVTTATVTTTAAATWGMTSATSRSPLPTAETSTTLPAAEASTALTAAEASTALTATEASTAIKAAETVICLALRECMRNTTAGITAAALRGKMRRIRAIVATRDPAIIAAKHIGPGK